MTENNEDYTRTMRDIDALQERLDQVFKRVNADPVYGTVQAVADAVSDHPRYFEDDRKKEVGEIFFALLDLIYERIVKQDRANPDCNPMFPSGGRLPETEMLMRDLMPLSWALEAKWCAPELADTVDKNFACYNEAERVLVYDVLLFLGGLFPGEIHEDVLEYWRKMAQERESLREESDEDKAFLLSVLIRKKTELDQKRSAKN